MDPKDLVALVESIGNKKTDANIYKCKVEPKEDQIKNHTQKKANYADGADDTQWWWFRCFAWC